MSLISLPLEGTRRNSSFRGPPVEWSWRIREILPALKCKCKQQYAVREELDEGLFSIKNNYWKIVQIMQIYMYIVFLSIFGLSS